MELMDGAVRPDMTHVSMDMNRRENGFMGQSRSFPRDTSNWQPEPNFHTDPFENMPMLIVGTQDEHEKEWMPGTLMFQVMESDRISWQVMDYSMLMTQIALDHNAAILRRGDEDTTPTHIAKRRRTTSHHQPLSLDTLENIAQSIAFIGTAGEPVDPVGLHGPGGNEYHRQASSLGDNTKVITITHFGTHMFPNTTAQEMKPNYRIWFVMKEVPARLRPDYTALRNSQGVNIGKILGGPNKLIPYGCFLCLPPHERPRLWSNPDDAKTPGQQPPITDVGFWKPRLDAAGEETGFYVPSVGIVWHIGAVKHFEGIEDIDPKSSLTTTRGANMLPKFMIDMRIRREFY